MCNVPDDIQRSLAIVLRAVLEHTDEGSTLGTEAQKCERWLAEAVEMPDPERSPNHETI